MLKDELILWKAGEIGGTLVTAVELNKYRAALLKNDIGDSSSDLAIKLAQVDAAIASLQAGGSGSGASYSTALSFVVYRTGAATANDPWGTPPATPAPLEWRGMLPMPTATEGFRNNLDTFRRTDVPLVRPA